MRSDGEVNSLAMPSSFAVDGIVARRLRAEDTAEMFAMHQDEVVMTGLGGVRGRAATESYMSANLAHWERWGFGIYRLSDCRDGTLVGRAGLRHVAIDGDDEIEVAYALLSPYWGRGLAVAVTLELLEIASIHGLGSSVVALALVSNHRSRRVMEKAGFVFERDFDHAGSRHALYRRRLGSR